MGPSWAALRQAPWLGTACHLHRPQATLFQNMPQSSPTSTAQSCIEQIIGKPQIIPKFHPQLQPAVTTTKRCN